RDFRAISGLGVECTVDADRVAHRVVVGTAALLAARGIEMTSPDLVGEAARDGAGIAIVAVDGRIAGALVLRDAVKPGSAAAVAGRAASRRRGGPPARAASLRLALATRRCFRARRGWAFGPRAGRPPAAPGVPRPFIGVLLNPGLAAGAMALSSVSVV